jgi:hypothetical protein
MNLKTDKIYLQFSLYERMFIQEASRRSKEVLNMANQMSRLITPTYILIANSTKNKYKE